MARSSSRCLLLPELVSRVSALWGADAADRFVPVNDVQGVFRVTGLVERPTDVGTGTRRVLLTVNGRAVRDIGIVRAAEAAYHSTIPSGVRPSVLLQLDIPGGEVDVNVHPAKAEVRFRDRWTLERAVERAVRRALGTEESAASVGFVRHVPAALPPLGQPLGVEMLRQVPAAAPVPLFDVADGDPASTPDVEPAEDPAAAIIVPPLFQFHRTYIAFERPDALVLIDQHSAHERVLYERFLHAFEGGEFPSQRLLFPLTLHLSPAEAEVFEAEQEALTKLGFEGEAFGGHSISVQSVPAPHPRFDAERCLRETLAALTGDRAPSAHARHTRLIATVACKAAVKSGDILLRRRDARALRRACTHHAPCARRAWARDHPADGLGRARSPLRSYAERADAARIVRIIAGPTGAGKSALAMHLAALHGARILRRLTADLSRLRYRHGQA
jgi:DNA mismatch repair protein MutL